MMDAISCAFYGIQPNTYRRKSRKFNQHDLLAKTLRSLAGNDLNLELTLVIDRPEWSSFEYLRREFQMNLPKKNISKYQNIVAMFLYDENMIKVGLPEVLNRVVHVCVGVRSVSLGSINSDLPSSYDLHANIPDFDAGNTESEESAQGKSNPFLFAPTTNEFSGVNSSGQSVNFMQSCSANPFLFSNDCQSAKPQVLEAKKPVSPPIASSALTMSLLAPSTSVHEHHQTALSTSNPQPASARASAKRDCSVLDEDTMKGLLLLRKARTVRTEEELPQAEPKPTPMNLMFVIKAKCGMNLQKVFGDGTAVAFAAAASENIDISLLDKYNESEWIFKASNPDNAQAILDRGQFRALGYDLVVSPHLPYI